MPKIIVAIVTFLNNAALPANMLIRPIPAHNRKVISFTSRVSAISIFGRPFLKQFALCYGSVDCLSVLGNVGVLWPNGWTDQHETWHAGRPRPWPHCVRWGPSFHSTKGAQPPPPN